MLACSMHNRLDVADGAFSASQDAPSSAASVAVLCVAVPAKPATRGAGSSHPPSPPSSPPSSPPPYSPPSPFVLRALAPASASQTTDARRGRRGVGGGGGERASRPASHPHCAALWLSTLVPAPAEFRICKSQTSRRSLPAPPPHQPSPRADRDAYARHGLRASVRGGPLGQWRRPCRLPVRVERRAQGPSHRGGARAGGGVLTLT